MSKYNDTSGKTIKAIFEDYAGELFLRKVQGIGSQAERTKKRFQQFLNDDIIIIIFFLFQRWYYAIAGGHSR